MRIVLDVENTTIKKHNKLHLDPFENSNTLTMVGVVDVDKPNDYKIFTFDHDEIETPDNPKGLQSILDKTTLLIMHNAQHDLQWLWCCGFKYNGEIFDTMLCEYVLLRGLKKPLSLSECSKRYELDQKKDTLKTYFEKGYTTKQIPYLELCEYLEYDLKITKDLYICLTQELKTERSLPLKNIIDITNNVCKVLTKMYINGFKVDMHVLKEVKSEFEKERSEILEWLHKKIKEVMGDTPLNLNSPEQVSQIVFSRKINSKKSWGEDLFRKCRETSWSKNQTFRNIINSNSKVMYKTKAFTCEICKGAKFVYKVRKDGSKFKKPNKCKNCDALGYTLKKLDEVAGLKFTPLNKKWVSASGFNTSKDILELLETKAKIINNKLAEEFLNKLRRYSALESYLNTYLKSIELFTKDDGYLHVALTQHITSTGSFSGRQPNMQNMPRGGTFPVKRVFVSRFEGGKILEADFAQLEFRVAAFLSQDKVAIKEIETGFDVHSYTAKFLTNAGQPTNRGQAKSRTFSPLFGSSPYGKTEADAAYIRHFQEKYKGISKWHKELGDTALSKSFITTPSGRQFSFPDIKRKVDGTPTHFTRIKNYPVQSLASADLIQICLIELDLQLDNCKSCIVNSVHDSLVVDVNPLEDKKVRDAVESINQNLPDLILKYLQVHFNVPLLLETKIGYNWLELKEI